MRYPLFQLTSKDCVANTQQRIASRIRKPVSRETWKLALIVYSMNHLFNFSWCTEICTGAVYDNTRPVGIDISTKTTVHTRLSSRANRARTCSSVSLCSSRQRTSKGRAPAWITSLTGGSASRDRTFRRPRTASTRAAPSDVLRAAVRYGTSSGVNVRWDGALSTLSAADASPASLPCRAEAIADADEAVLRRLASPCSFFCFRRLNELSARRRRRSVAS